MTPREILEKYGLKTDVKSIKERIRWIGAYKVASSLTDDPLMILNIKMEIQQADLDLLCEMAERAEKLEDFITNCFVECDEYDMQPTILCDKDGKEIVDRWRKELEELK